MPKIAYLDKRSDFEILLKNYKFDAIHLENVYRAVNEIYKVKNSIWDIMKDILTSQGNNNYSLWSALSEKCPNMELFLVRIFPHSDWIWRDTKYSVRMRENADQKNLRVWTLFTQWWCPSFLKKHGNDYPDKVCIEHGS